MAFDVRGMAATYDLPQHVGQLFSQKGARPNALLRAIGGISGVVRTIVSNEFSIAETFVRQTPAQPAILEGADPTAGEQQLTQDKNVIQIFQEATGLSYSAQSNESSFGGLQVIPGGGNGSIVDPASFAFQLGLLLDKVQNDLNFSMVQGAFQLPTDNTTARKMRGVGTAITTNVDENSAAGRALTKAIFEGAIKTAIDAQNIALGSGLFAFATADQFENLIDLYDTSTDVTPPESRTVAGLMIRTILSKWGEVQLVYEPDVKDFGGGGSNQGSIMLLNLSFIEYLPG